ncbi:ABC transporter ATP-binding protein [Lacticaseibacillus thailandensis]|nr:ABC transporter ATP-binding protein [Lacticaseibacillus thailandensis]
MLELTGVTKRFGKQVAVDQISLTVKPGEILGLIGQNGAGKTTTFRMILDFLHPDSGTVQWQGQAMSKIDHDFIGYLPEERGLYPKLSIVEQIEFFGQLHGMTRTAVRDALPEWLERFEVKGKLTDKVKDLSKGNQQKVQLIAALIFMPKLVILDEPFSGLDPVNASLLEAGVRYLQTSGSAIIFSSHNMRNVESLSDRLVMLKNGAVVLAGTVGEIRAQYGETRISLTKPRLSADALAQLPGVLAVQGHGDEFELQLDDPERGQAIFQTVTQGEYIAGFQQHAPSLDEIFRRKAGDEHA